VKLLLSSRLETWAWNRSSVAVQRHGMPGRRQRHGGDVVGTHEQGRLLGSRHRIDPVLPADQHERRHVDLVDIGGSCPPRCRRTARHRTGHGCGRRPWWRPRRGRRCGRRSAPRRRPVASRRRRRKSPRPRQRRSSTRTSRERPPSWRAERRPRPRHARRGPAPRRSHSREQLKIREELPIAQSVQVQRHGVGVIQGAGRADEMPADLIVPPSLAQSIAVRLMF